MMNEADPASGMNNLMLMDAAGDLEDKINAALGTNFGSLGNKFGSALNGSDPATARIIKNELSKSTTGSFGSETYGIYAPEMVNLAFILNGKPAPRLQISALREEISISGKLIVDSNFRMTLNAAGAYLASQLGVA